ncbi:hypothetical protein BT96DRAFT_837019, partial [Gymnopus androsaceus JB14]
MGGNGNGNNGQPPNDQSPNRSNNNSEGWSNNPRYSQSGNSRINDFGGNGGGGPPDGQGPDDNNGRRNRGSSEDDERLRRDREKDLFNRELNRQSKLELNKPQTFSGEKREEFRTFQDACENTFVAKALIYETDDSQIAFAGSYLSGAALRHFQSLMRRKRNGENVLAFLSWTSFILHLAELFGL